MATVLILVAASLGAGYALGDSTRSIATATFTTTTTSVTTKTISTSSPASTTTQVTTWTLTLFSSVGGGSVLVLNSSDGLSLSVQVDSTPNGNYTITVKESNLLNAVNNVTAADEWKYPEQSLNPCGTPSPPGPVELVVARGSFGQDNFASAKALPLYNTGNLYTCGRATILGGSNAYAFQPLSDAYAFPSGSALPDHGTSSVTISTNGYWTGGQDGVPPAFKPFDPGFYTAIGADEWGNVVLLQFFVS